MITQQFFCDLKPLGWCYALKQVNLRNSPTCEIAPPDPTYVDVTNYYCIHDLNIWLIIIIIFFCPQASKDIIWLSFDGLYWYDLWLANQRCIICFIYLYKNKLPLYWNKTYNCQHWRFLIRKKCTLPIVISMVLVVNCREFTVLSLLALVGGTSAFLFLF